jgi:CRISPR-associated protein Csd2
MNMNNSVPELTLNHNLIKLPQGKKAIDAVDERHDIVLLFDATKANPNGDPDAGNMPRMQPDSLKGLVTDVCLKRKIRNFFSLYTPEGKALGAGKADPGYDIFIRENAVLQKLMEAPQIEQTAKRIFTEKLGQNPESWDAKKKKAARKKAGDGGEEPAEATDAAPADEQKKRAYRDALCQSYFDLRAFGGVISTEGPLKSSFYGQVRGPIQFTFAESLDRVLQLDATITRCAVASEKERAQPASEDAEETGNRTIGRKSVIDYGLYRASVYVSAAFAHKTGFSYYDLDNFLFALLHMFRDDNAAGRTGLRVVGLVDFQHATCLGNEQAHKLFDQVVVERTPESLTKEFPSDLNDYCGASPEGIVSGDENNQQVIANRLVWEIPENRAAHAGAAA